jgi:V8-like Glu-specific endopeptidase
MKMLCLFFLFYQCHLWAIIIGENNQVEVDAEIHPYNKVVSLSTGCNGVLVGRNLVLTAAHCISSSITNQQGQFKITRTIKVSAGYSLKKKTFTWETKVKKAIWGSFAFQSQYPLDWAILTTEDYLGDRLGYLGYFHTLNSFMVKDFELVHFQKTTKRFVKQTNCEVKNTNVNQLLKHDCDVEKGSSGAPLIQCNYKDQCYVIGIQSGEIHGEKINTAVSITQIAPQLISLAQALNN